MPKTTRSAPGPQPKARRPDKRVFLPKALWEKLSEAASFHEESFKAMGRDEAVSRNDIIEDFLKWALDEYWHDKKGEPLTPAERAAKVQAFAERLKKEEEAREKNGDGN